MSSKMHWDTFYKSHAPAGVSWHQPHLTQSLQLISRTGIDPAGDIIDVGGGASTLVDDLLDQRFTHVAVLDISSEVLNAARSRLGERADDVTWIEADVTEAALPHHGYEVWHDRAVFHFLTRVQEREGYVRAVRHALQPGGHLIMATFGLNGPTRCSGLEVIRYSAETLRAEFGEEFTLLERLHEEHRTPFGTQQAFIYCYFRRSSTS